MIDPDELSTKLYRTLENSVKEEPTGTYVSSEDETILEELMDEGYCDHIDRSENHFKARLNGRGLELIKIIRG